MEKLDEHYGIKLGEGTVRKLMNASGLWTPRRRGAKHRAWRPRRLCVGLLVQLDGSDHDWFEGRGPRCVLIIYIDDASSRILYGEFVTVEDTLTLMRTTRTCREAVAAASARRGPSLAAALQGDSHAATRAPGDGVTATATASERNGTIARSTPNGNDKENGLKHGHNNDEQHDVSTCGNNTTFLLAVDT